MCVLAMLWISPSSQGAIVVIVGFSFDLIICFSVLEICCCILYLMALFVLINAACLESMNLLIFRVSYGFWLLIFFFTWEQHIMGDNLWTLCSLSNWGSRIIDFIFGLHVSIARIQVQFVLRNFLDIMLNPCIYLALVLGIF